LISSEAQTLHAFFETERYFDKHYNKYSIRKKNIAKCNLICYINQFVKNSKYRTSFDPFSGAPHGGVGSGVDEGERKTKLEGSKK